MTTTFDRLMENEQVSIRELAHKAGVSPITIQKMRSGKAENIKHKT